MTRLLLIALALAPRAPRRAAPCGPADPALARDRQCHTEHPTVLRADAPHPVDLNVFPQEVGGSWLLITGLLTRFGALAILGTMTVAIYHAVITSGFNIYLLELLGLYFAAVAAILAVGPGKLSVDELIVRRFSPDARSQADRLEAAFAADEKSGEDVKADVVADGVS